MPNTFKVTYAQPLYQENTAKAMMEESSGATAMETSDTM